MVHQEIDKINKLSDELLPPLTKDEFIKIKTALDPYDFAVIDQLGMKILAIRSPTDFPDMVTDLEVVAPELSLDEPETLTHAVIIGNNDNLGVPVEMVASLLKMKKEDDARIVSTIRDKIKHPLETYLFKDQYDQKAVLRLGIRSPMPLEELQSKDFKEVFEGVPVPNGTRVVYIIAADGYMKVSAKEFLREMGEAVAPPPIMFHRAMPQPEEKTPQMKDIDVNLGDIIDHQFTVSDDPGEKKYTLGPPREPPAAKAPPEPPAPAVTKAPEPPVMEAPPEVPEPQVLETTPELPGPEVTEAPAVELEAPPEMEAATEEFEEVSEERPLEEPAPQVTEEPATEMEAPPEMEAATEEFEEVPEEPPTSPEDPVVELDGPAVEPEPPTEMVKEVPGPVPLTPPAPMPLEVLELTPVEVPPPPEDPHPHIVMKPIPDPILPNGTPVGPYETLETAPLSPYETLEEKMAVETPYVVKESEEPITIVPPAPCPPPPPVPIPIPQNQAEDIPQGVFETLPVAEEAAPGCKDVIKLEAPEPEEVSEEALEPLELAPPEPTPVPQPAPIITEPSPPKPLILRRDEGGSHVEKLTERMAPEEPLSTQMGPLSEASSKWFTAPGPTPAPHPAPTKAQEIMGEGVKRARITDIRTALMAADFGIKPEGAPAGFDIQATKRYRTDVVVLVSYIASPRLRDYMEFERRLRAFPDGVGVFISEGPPDKDMKINAIGKPIAMIGIDEIRDIELYVRDIVL